MHTYLIDQIKNSIHTSINCFTLNLILKNFRIFDKGIDAAKNGQHFLFCYHSIIVQIVKGKRPV